MLIIATFQNYWNSSGLPLNSVQPHPDPHPTHTSAHRLVRSILPNIMISIKAECVSVQIWVWDVRLCRHSSHGVIRTGVNGNNKAPTAHV